MPIERKNPPVATDFMESAQSFGNYNLAFSLADLIDNSITAEATQIDINDDFEEKEIRITDNGLGMTEDELYSNMRMGSRNPNTDNSEQDLGRFGLGLKTASFAQARCLTVISKKEGVFTGAQWDLDDVEGFKMLMFSHWEAEILASENFPGHGTEVIWTKLNRLLEDGTVDFDTFNSMMVAAENEISLVFHRYLSGELNHRPKLTITRNGRKLIHVDPFCQANDSTQKKTEDNVPFDRNGKITNIKVKPFILPHYTQLSPAEDEQLGGQEGYIKNQGFYIYRQYRLIIKGTWFKLAPHGEFSKLARIRVDIPNSLDIDWKISVDKSEAELPWDLKLTLKSLLANWVLDDSIRVLVKRKPKAKEKFKPVWNRHNTAAGVWQFTINSNHPFLAVFARELATLDKENGTTRLTTHFKDIIRLIENCLPLEPIKESMDEKPQTINAGFTDAQEVLGLALKLREAFIKGAYSEAYLNDQLKTNFPFSEYYEQIQEYFDNNPIES